MMKSVVVSVSAKSANDLFTKARQNRSVDIIELRFDGLEPNQIDHAVGRISNLKNELSAKLLITYRPRSYGGLREINLEQRIAFWNSITNIDALIVDIEPDIYDFVETNKFDTVISSQHDFAKSTFDPESLIKNLLKTGDIAKLAFHVEEPFDGIGAFKMLDKYPQKCVPIAMGESGIWTRILGLGYGAPLTFCSPDADNHTAPGQIPYDQLLDCYRVKSINRETQVYGLLGKPIAQSSSPFIHNRFFKFEEINATYIGFQTDNMPEFFRRFLRANTRELDLNFRGFSVTIPNKIKIINELDFIDEGARAIGAVNTVAEIDGHWCGFNTDAAGFLAPLIRRKLGIANRKFAIIGAGGAARACIFALKNAGAEILLVARNEEKGKMIATEFECVFAPLNEFYATESRSEIVVNATPIGMYSHSEGNSPLTKNQIAGSELVYDLIHNPLETELFKIAKELNIDAIGGLEMLISQAALQQKIWTGVEPNQSTMISEIKKYMLSNNSPRVQ